MSFPAEPLFPEDPLIPEELFALSSSTKDLDDFSPEWIESAGGVSISSCSSASSNSEDRLSTPPTSLNDKTPDSDVDLLSFLDKTLSVDLPTALPPLVPPTSYVNLAGAFSFSQPPLAYVSQPPSVSVEVHSHTTTKMDEREMKRQLRLMKNREAAYVSRQRKRQLQDEVDHTLQLAQLELQHEKEKNAILSAENALLRNQVSFLQGLLSPSAAGLASITSFSPNPASSSAPSSITPALVSSSSSSSSLTPPLKDSATAAPKPRYGGGSRYGARMATMMMLVCCCALCLQPMSDLGRTGPHTGSLRLNDGVSSGGTMSLEEPLSSPFKRSLLNHSDDESLADSPEALWREAVAACWHALLACVLLLWDQRIRLVAALFVSLATW
eukprot:CAMPEP_0184646150 /NCGR_PEP_ID=MMETSP0308-20130426/2779_1 /TAXON_ID=38269 /ORGANISM="Gloeochaete witrockiana, Strain SAG 46.84" /LENGTH=383 /DNA_ID=CAMNT_0027075859 /DNA_START=45 /DNA_END=1193 /DNA_ORIENTATION=+